jgi:hypothetical protein
VVLLKLKAKNPPNQYRIANGFCDNIGLQDVLEAHLKKKKKKKKKEKKEGAQTVRSLWKSCTGLTVPSFGKVAVTAVS